MSVQKTNDWRRVAVKPNTGKKLDILLTLVNMNRAVNDRMSLYDLAAEIVDAEWQKAKARGLLSAEMLKLDDAEHESKQPVYVAAEPVA